MSRRATWLNLAVSLGMLFALLMAGVSATQAKGSAAAKPNGACSKAKKNTPKGTIKFSNWQFPDEFNIYQWGDLTTSVNAQALVQEGYYSYDQNARRVPLGILATIPTVKNGGIKDGGKTWYLHIKKGMKWNNGTEITSKDIAFGWKIDMDPVTGPLCLGSCDNIARIDTPDAYTAVLHMKTTFANVLGALPDFWPTKWPGAYNGNAHQAALWWAQNTNVTCETASQCPTNGPYQVKEWVKDDRIVFTPMKYYNIDYCGAKISSPLFVFYSSKQGMIAAAAAHQTDLTTNYTLADLPTLKSNAGKYKMYNRAAFTFEHMEFNVDPTYNGKPNPLANAKVRQALALALDKYGLAESALGISRSVASKIIGWSPIVQVPGLVAPFADTKLKGQWDPETKKYTTATGTGKALADAKKLLDSTPYKGGFTIDAFTTAGNPVRQAQFSVAQANWARLGVKLNPNYVPASKLFGGWDAGGITAHGTFQIAMFAFGVAPDPDFMRFLLGSKFIERDRATHPCAVCQNNSGVKDSTLDKYLNAGIHTVSNSARSKDYAAAQVRLNQMAYWIPLYFRPELDTTDNKVKPFAPSPVSGPNWNAQQWSVS